LLDDLSTALGVEHLESLLKYLSILRDTNKEAISMTEVDIRCLFHPFHLDYMLVDGKIADRSAWS
jgi:hypothetical protein